MEQSKLYAVMTFGGLVGLVASFIQIIEKLQLLKHAVKALSCDLNSVFSCTNVLNAWQSSVFGFPNSLICIVFFTSFALVGTMGWSGGTLTRRFRLAVQGMALFMLGFALWFLSQSTYVIHALCYLCLVCFAGLLMINWAWLRTNVNDLSISSNGRAMVKRAVITGADTFIWVVLALIVGLAMLLKFI